MLTWAWNDYLEAQMLQKIKTEARISNWKSTSKINNNEIPNEWFLGKICMKMSFSKYINRLAFPTTLQNINVHKNGAVTQFNLYVM